MFDSYDVEGIDLVTDFMSGTDLLVFEGFGPAAFAGQQSGFTSESGAEVFFDHLQHEDHGAITSLHVRDDIGDGTDTQVYLLGHIDLTADDVFVV